MRQIYYTQCPIGYGLGASNGFQIKRLSQGYPISGDFRHLGLRAFVAGTRTMAPPALRYRRAEDGSAEVAWLTPRSNEYETERGLWGRPGGHFAHGILLDADELGAIADWPAGLYDRPFWTRTDREPSRGQPPAELGLSADDLGRPPTFEAVAPIAGSINLDPDRLARLLSATAWAAREGRTVFLIDDQAGRLADLIALLTFAFPDPWRPALTFSTYHDRPEELPGFRLQGTLASARPNKPALHAQGVVVDLLAGTFDPVVEPSQWARTLSGWLLDRGENDREAWEATERRSRRLRVPREPEAIWSEEWLERAFGFEPLVRQAVSGPPANAAGWAELAAMAVWSGRVGLGAEWADARPAGWWASAPVEIGEGLDALLAHLGLPESWRGGSEAADWGEIVAHGVSPLDPDARQRVIARVLRAAPPTARKVFIRALVAALPAEVAGETLRWLEAQPDSDRALILPLKVRSAVAAALDAPRDPRALRDVLAEAYALPAALTDVLDALAAEAAVRPASREALATLLAGTLNSAEPRTIVNVQTWALRRTDDGQVWIGRYFRRLFADPHNLDEWRNVRRNTPGTLLPALARVVLGVALDPTLPDEAFRWGVEEVLLPIPEADRPHDPTWPGAYLDRTPSGLDLLRKLFAKDFRDLGIRRWLDQARGRGELSEGQGTRIDECATYARVLRSGDARSLLEIRLPAVPAEERGVLLGQILNHLGGGPGRSLAPALDACRDAWPGGFAPGAPGLDGLAHALAGPLLDGSADITRWFARLVALLDRLGLTVDGGGFEPDGLAAWIVAETTRRAGPDLDPWRLRQTLLQNEAAWRVLAVDVRYDMGDGAVKALDRWDSRLVKGMHTARFFELWLNVCEGPALAASIASRAVDLRSLGALPWWDSARDTNARNDIRDRFARLAPMAPLDEDKLPGVQNLLRKSFRAEPVAVTPASDFDPLPVDDVPAPGPTRRESTVADASPLSARGQARWRCIEALSAFHRSGLDTGGRWQMVGGWGSGSSLPLGELESADRYRFTAWLIRRLDESEPAQIHNLARWLFDRGVSDVDRINHWADELDGLAEVPNDLRIGRMAMVGELRAELKSLSRLTGSASAS